MKKSTAWALRIGLTLLIIGIAYYIYLPPIHAMSISFWTFLIFCIGVVAVFLLSSTRIITKRVRLPGYSQEKTFRIPGRAFMVAIAGAVVLVAVLAVVGFISSTPILHAGKYAQLIERQEGHFSQDVAQIPWDRIPTVDHDTAARLGNRKMGEVVELVSQFNVSDEYMQVNFQGDPVRVSPLNYASLIKWVTNQSQGIPYYMAVDMIDGSTDLVQLDEGIRYSKSEYLNRNIERHLRFQYPFKIFRNSNFEIDEEGHPVWVTPVYRMQVGLFGAPDVTQVILTDAVTGQSEIMKVEEVPTWVDRVYDASLVLDQIGYNGRYQSGFLNSVIGQRGVLAPTDGYNYLALNDDVYLYTGITSVSADESNIGFVLVNMRTKDCQFYPVPSAEEFSAMDSAQGAVQEKRYTATFPLLINMNDRPTYFLSLKDDAGLIKMYAFIDAQDYQNVVTAPSVEEAYKTYASRAGLTLDEGPDPENLKQIDGGIADIAQVLIEGESYYTFLLAGDAHVYMAPLSTNPYLPFVGPGEGVLLEYSEGADTLRRVVSLSFPGREGQSPADPTLAASDSGETDPSPAETDPPAETTPA